MGRLMIFISGFIIFNVVGLLNSQSSNSHEDKSLSTSTSGVIIKLNSADPGTGIRRHYGGWREWRRADPTLINSLWKSKMGNGIRKQLGKAEIYIILALLIGFVTVVIGCWLSDNCWTPEPEDSILTLA